MDLMELGGGGSSIELWLGQREHPGLDAELRRRVRDELEWEPGLDATRIEIDVRDCAVTLRGVVRSYTEKAAALAATGRVPRVCDLTDEVCVQLPATHARTDATLLEEVENVLGWDAQVRADHVRISVLDGIVTLAGWVEWDHQREAAERAVRPLIGVRGIENVIAVRPKWTTGELRPAVVAALHRHRDLHTKRVTIESGNGAVRLRGRVPSLAERAAIEHVVWSVPGVIEVVDELAIER
jgi:osmotically-inducible protein OsmY